MFLLHKIILLQCLITKNMFLERLYQRIKERFIEGIHKIINILWNYIYIYILKNNLVK